MEVGVDGRLSALCVCVALVGVMWASTRRAGCRVRNGNGQCAVWSCEAVVEVPARLEFPAAPNHSIDLELRSCLRLVETVPGENDGECSGEPWTARVVGTIDRPNRT